jgi:hypothetical protein
MMLYQRVLNWILLLESGFLTAWYVRTYLMVLIGPSGVEDQWLTALRLVGFGVTIGSGSAIILGLSAFRIMKLRALILWPPIILSVYTGTLFSYLLYKARNDFPAPNFNIPLTWSALLLVSAIAAFHSIREERKRREAEKVSGTGKREGCEGDIAI